MLLLESLALKSFSSSSISYSLLLSTNTALSPEQDVYSLMGEFEIFSHSCLEHILWLQECAVVDLKPAKDIIKQTILQNSILQHDILFFPNLMSVLFHIFKKQPLINVSICFHYL